MKKLYVVEYWFWSKGKRSSWHVWPQMFPTSSEAKQFAKIQALEGGAKSFPYQMQNRWVEVSA